MSDSAVAEEGLLRTTAPITAWNLVSRVTGFVRVIAIGAALGTTFLGNTYQSSNLVSNILFELLAAGLLSSVLVPTFVARVAKGEREEAEHLAGALLGVLLAGLGVVVLAGAVAGPWLMRALTVAVPSHGVRHAEVRLGSFFLWFFLPQVLLYAAGAVATGLLYADRRFVAASAAPVANNIVVVATMGVFWAMRSGARPGLGLPLSQQLVLALGTTAGVVTMTAVPMVAAWRAGLRLRPRWDPGHAGLRELGRRGLWAAAYLGLTQLLIATTLILANRVEGGVVAYQIAFTFFLLPHALIAHPIYTALYPQLSEDAEGGRWDDFARRLGHGIRLSALFLLPAAALLAAVARPVLRVVAIGALAAGGRSLVAPTLAAYAVGLIGYSGFQLLTRASYATGDTRSPTLVNLVVSVGGAGLMIVWSGHAGGAHRVVVLGLAHSAAMLAGAALLLVVVRRRTGTSLHSGAALVKSAVCAVAAGVVAQRLVLAFHGAGRGDASLAIAAAGLAGTAVYFGGQRLLGGRP
ncbi:MAG: hypothetical protein E6G17_03275 [Actinobacteria bacterium]|nr:MAG: hypothetical protein E6G17_03275 [Actinomycetota bacterium]